MNKEECLGEILSLLGDDDMVNEARVVLWITRRFVSLGARQYGRLELHDGRDSLDEAGQEAADLMFYLAKHSMEVA